MAMKRIVRLTEGELMGVIRNSVMRIVREDVLGNDWMQNDEDGAEEVFNNYEPFEDQSDESDDEFDL